MFFNPKISRRFHRRFCWSFILVGAALIALPLLRCSASDVKMTNGEVYKNVTILKRDGKSVEILTQFGKITLPLPAVESIDGVSIWVAPVHQALAVPSTSAAPAPGTSPAAGVPAVSGTQAAVPSIVDLLGSQSPTPQPVAVQSSGTGTLPQNSNWPNYEHNLKMDLVLLAMAAIAALWIGSVGSVQRSLFERRADPRFWSNMAILLPGVGYLLYQAACKLSDAKARKAANATPNELVARREKAAVKHRRGFEFLDDDRKAVLVKSNGEISGVENARDILEEALLERASDVHIEPTEDEYGIRFRVDGIMHSRMTFSRVDGQRLVSALKTLAQIDVAEKRKAQDGRFRVRTGDSDIDFRVATANSIFGEKLVIRILDRKAGLLGLSDLGMPQEMKDQFARVIQSRNGMILATGPTGSGKTSTLYSALSQLDAKRLNIMTIEDPVEYELSGATQIPVNVKAGVTYESGLRSLLRQDPDVIFVGEMRDAEAAQIALRAALTGHLVFSSLHTRDAIGTIIRLEEMGIERHLLASSLMVLIAQRLVRVLCPDCREPYPSKGDELHDIGLELPAGMTIHRAKGCKKCNDTGYVGRTGIFEMVVFDEALRQAVNNGAQEVELIQLARAAGYRGFRENGGEKILDGITSVEEVLQAS